jgi:hypothetical protein
MTLLKLSIESFLVSHPVSSFSFVRPPTQFHRLFLVICKVTKSMFCFARYGRFKQNCEEWKTLVTWESNLNAEMNRISKCSLQSIGFKGLEVKPYLWLSSNRIALFHWTLDLLPKWAYGCEPNTKVDLRWRGSIAWTYDQVVFLGRIIRRFLL